MHEHMMFRVTQPDGITPMSETSANCDRPARSCTFGALALGLVLGAAWVTNEARAQVPGPEIFGKPPTTPMELWDAVDYLVRTGQAKQAVPYIEKFLDSRPEDEALLQVRDRFGAGSFLRLQDHAPTRKFAEPLVQKIGEASRRQATKPERIAGAIAALTKSREEQDYGVSRLRDAGPFGVPPLLQEIDRASDNPESRALLVRNMGRLDISAVPPLLAALRASKPALVIDAAEALGRIRDHRAIPALTALAASGERSLPERDAARRAIERLTGRPFGAQAKTPLRLLTDEARRYHTHAIRFPGDPVLIWVWDEASQAPVPRTVSKSEAEGYFGLSLARAALAIDPTDRAAQVVLVSLALEKAVERTGFDKFPEGDASNTLATAVSAGSAVLSDVLRTAIVDRKDDLAAVAAGALGKVTDTNALAVNGQANPLVEALSAPGRRARFAAARALVALDPRKPFAGSSRVVPTLAQYVTTQGEPRAVVIDGNVANGSKLAGYLKALGYEPDLAMTGADGFRAASESADVEVVFVEHALVQGDWKLHDTLANLRADARTAGLPIYIVGPLASQVDLGSLLDRFPGVKFVVTPTDAKTLDRQLAFGGRPRLISDEERSSYAKEAAVLLAQIAARPGSPFASDLNRIEPELTTALNLPETSLAASAVLGDVADPNAQRGLADVLIDPSKPWPLRVSAAAHLARSVQRFGPLVAADQEAKLLSAFDREVDPALRTALGTVIGALRPKAAPIGARLRRLDSGTSPTPSTSPDPTTPSPDSVPAASPSPEAPPSPAEAKP
jgi:hypothetical protein